MKVKEKNEKVKNNVKNNILNSAEIYKTELAGKYYLYVFENLSFEMYYGIENFKHLTGADSKLTPVDFYRKAKDKILQTSQLDFSPRFPLSVALKKSNELCSLGDFAKEGFFVVKDYITKSVTYPYAITNLDNSLLLGLMLESKEEIYVPKSFRVKDKSFDKAQEGNVFQIDYIFSKKDKLGLYDTLAYRGKSPLSCIEKDIKDKLDDSLIADMDPCDFDEVASL